jgi:dihydrofolate reductase
LKDMIRIQPLRLLLPCNTPTFNLSESPALEHVATASGSVVVSSYLDYTRLVIVSIIAAASENNVIGKSGTLPWSLPAELQYFRSVTAGKPVIMGRKTHESIGRLLPHRHNIVVSRSGDVHMEGLDVVPSVDDAITLAKMDGAEEAFIIGGGQMYAEALSTADRLYLTRVHAEIEGGDTFFPAFNESEWELVQSNYHEADAENPVPFTTMVYERKMRDISTAQAA